MCPTSSLDFDVDVFPKLDVSSRITLPHACLRKFSIQPRVQRRREHAYILFLVTKGHFSIGKRTFLFGAPCRSMLVAVEPA
jgi:hypothetical protein